MLRLDLSSIVSASCFELTQEPEEVLANADGNREPVCSAIGDEGKAVVIFLRHLG